MGEPVGPGSERAADSGSCGEAPPAAKMSGEGLRRGAVSAADGASRSLGEPGRPAYEANGGVASRPPHPARTREDKVRMREAMREALKFEPIYRTIWLDPCNLESRYSQDEIREMIAEGKVIELIGRIREVERP